MNPQDLLLAYNPEFIEYTSLNSMPQPVEPETIPLAALGGTASSDGYFEDFTDTLGGFVNNYPLLASSYGGSELHNWRARVITFGSRGYGGRSNGSSDDERSDDERSDNKRSDNKRSEHSEHSERSEHSEHSEHKGSAGEGHHLPLTEFGNFIVNVVGGDTLRPEDGTMDETDAEAGSYEQFNTWVVGKSNAPRVENSILNFTADK